MRQLVWSNTFRRALRRTLRRKPQLREEIQATLTQLQEDPFAPRLATHKLKGKLAGTGACSASFDLRSSSSSFRARRKMRTTCS